MGDDSMTLKFWGVCGSIPAPLTPSGLEGKIGGILRAALAAGVTPETADDWLSSQPRHAASTYGGNTSCVEVRAGGRTVIIDMGSGLRELGNSLMPEIFRRGSLQATVLVSHVHWDHIQGFPFFGPIYLPPSKAKVSLDLWGGVNWRKSLKRVLHEQMRHPVFPLSFKRVEQEGAAMRFRTLSDGLSFALPAAGGDLKISCRRLNHPQETYGFRLEYGGAVAAYTSDNEDYLVPDPALVELVSGADLWIDDCQFDKGEYCGCKGGPPKVSWGHSEPEYVAAVAKLARPKRILTFHHNPGAGDCRIAAIAAEVNRLSGIPAEPAYEGQAIAL